MKPLGMLLALLAAGRAGVVAFGAPSSHARPVTPDPARVGYLGHSRRRDRL